MMKSVAAMVMAAVISGQSAPRVMLKGVVRDCEGADEVRVSGISVLAFDPARSRELVRLAQSLDTTVLVISDTAAMRRSNLVHDRLMSLITGSTPLARGRTGAAAGDVTLSVPRLDSVFVFGYRNLDDDPNYYAYRMVSAKARGSFFLDMSRGACRYND